MLVLNEEYHPVDKVASFVWYRIERERMTTFVYLLGKLVAYLPHNHRAYYQWLLVLTYRPAQHISVYQFSPRHLRVIIASRWELGIVLGSWGLGLRLRQPLFWLKRVHAT